MIFRLWFAFILTAQVAAAAAPVLRPAPEPADTPAGMSVCECVTNKICWGVVQKAFAMNAAVKKTEVEGALPGRFFLGTQTATLAHADKHGHFLRVTCGDAHVPCPSFRDLLEARLAVSTLVQSVSRVPEDTLFSPTTWALTGAGEAVQQEAKRCRPGIWSELVPVLVGVSVWN
jgi:hypothetical protein